MREVLFTFRVPALWVEPEIEMKPSPSFTEGATYWVKKSVPRHIHAMGGNIEVLAEFEIGKAV